MLPFEEDLERLDTITGIGRRTSGASSCAAHLCSWVGLAPGNNESAGKRKSSRTWKGNEKLKSALVEAARAASRTKNTYFKSQYHRIAARRGANRAAVAVDHSIPTVIYHMLKRKSSYFELGPDYLEEKKASDCPSNS